MPNNKCNTLDTDSCRRRDQVEHIILKLMGAVKEWNQSYKLQAALQQKGLDWIYNPPVASHYGGGWERFIKQVKLKLLALTKDQTLDD